MKSNQYIYYLQTTKNVNTFFFSILEKMLIDIPLNCPTIIIGGFNVNILKTLKSTMLENFTNKYKFQPTFSRCITIYNT
jgi:hypothetical protein